MKDGKIIPKIGDFLYGGLAGEVIRAIPSTTLQKYSTQLVSPRRIKSLEMNLMFSGTRSGRAAEEKLHEKDGACHRCLWTRWHHLVRHEERTAGESIYNDVDVDEVQVDPRGFQEGADLSQLIQRWCVIIDHHIITISNRHHRSSSNIGIIMSMCDSCIAHRN